MSPQVSPAVRDAVSDVVRIIRVCFIVSAPVIPSRVIWPTTAPAYDLLLGLKSLSYAAIFRVSIRWNEYAFLGLRAFYNRLRIATDSCSRTCLRGIHPNGEDGVEVAWNRVRYGHNPPHYDAKPAAKLYVAQSSPKDFTKDDTLANSAADERIPETPVASPEPRVSHGIFSQSPAALDLVRPGESPVDGPGDYVIFPEVHSSYIVPSSQ